MRRKAPARRACSCRATRPRLRASPQDGDAVCAERCTTARCQQPTEACCADLQWRRTLCCGQAALAARSTAQAAWSGEHLTCVAPYTTALWCPGLCGQLPEHKVSASAPSIFSAAPFLGPAAFGVWRTRCGESCRRRAHHHVSARQACQRVRAAAAFISSSASRTAGALAPRRAATHARTRAFGSHAHAHALAGFSPRLLRAPFRAAAH